MLKSFQQKINIVFKNEQLLTQALTHTSYVNEHRNRKQKDNERLEFLGDAVLELAVSQYLFRNYPELKEGELTKIRANIVCEPSLEQFAKKIALNEYLLLGKGEENNGGRLKPSILSDAFEALIGAIYLDQGLEKVSSFLDQVIFANFDASAFSHVMDYKTALQELVQKKGEVVTYEIVKEIGPAHSKEFVSHAIVDGEIVGIGKGKSKKDAEQRAAKEALNQYEKAKRG